jgi:hypothetical protein
VKRPMVLGVVAATMVLAPVVVTGPAQAEVHGVNGRIAFERLAPGQPFEAPGNGTVFVANLDGTHSQQVPLVYPTDVVTPIDWSPDERNCCSSTRSGSTARATSCRSGRRS